MFDVLLKLLINIFKYFGGVKKLIKLIKEQGKTILLVLLWSAVIALTTVNFYDYFSPKDGINIEKETKNKLAYNSKKDDCYCPPCQRITNNYNNIAKCDFYCD